MASHRFVRLLLLGSLLAFWQQVGAQTNAGSNCFATLSEPLQLANEACQKHQACEWMLEAQGTCPARKSFLDSLSSQLESERGFFSFSKERTVKASQVWQALLQDSLVPKKSKSDWAAQLEALDKRVEEGGQEARQNGDGKNQPKNSIFYGPAPQGQPFGEGIFFERTSNGWRALKGHFDGLTLSGIVDALKDDGKVVTRQISTYENGKIKPNTDSITLNTLGMTMEGRYDDTMAFFEGTMTQPDGSRMEGRYHLATGNGQVSMYRADGTLLERGEYVGNQLYVGDRFDAQGKPIAHVDKKKEQEAKLDAERRNEAEKAMALQAERQAKLEAQNRTLVQTYERRLQTEEPQQLFLQAEAFLNAGDKYWARRSLRALIARFPNHPLVAGASTMLAGMAQHSPGSDTAQSVETQQTTQASQPLSCEEAQQSSYTADTRVGSTGPLRTLVDVRRDHIREMAHRLIAIQSNCRLHPKYRVLVQEAEKRLADSIRSCKEIAASESICQL